MSNMNRLPTEPITGELLEFAHDLADRYDGDITLNDISKRFCERTEPALVTRKNHVDAFGRDIFNLVVVDLEQDPHIMGVDQWTDRTTRLLKDVGQGAINGFVAEIQQSVTLQKSIEFDQWIPQLLTQQPEAEAIAGEV